ncbi:MAG: hypothetical protein OEL83_19865 [Desulforhopalus sp.]|nr:hypothetical protein [Desulforhopalus sp.]
MLDENPLKPADIAKMFNQSISWVSKNSKKFGGIKIGGRMFFPPKEVLYERLFCGEEGVEIRLHDEEHQVHSGMVYNQERGKGSRAKKKTGIGQTDVNRHGLFDVGQSATR